MASEAGLGRCCEGCRLRNGCEVSGGEGCTDLLVENEWDDHAYAIASVIARIHDTEKRCHIAQANADAWPDIIGDFDRCAFMAACNCPKSAAS
jgi:hypothetical protein